MASYNSSPDYEGTGGANSITFAFKCYIGYGNVTRSGNTVTIPIGLKMVPVGSGGSTWCYNSVGGWCPDTSSRSNLRYAFKTTDSAYYCSPSDTLYCTSQDTPSNGTKYKTDNTPWTVTKTVSASDTSVNVTVYATWCQWDLSYTHLSAHKVVAVTRSIPIPAATAPSGTVSISSVSRTSASYSVSASAGNYTTISSYEWSISPSATISNKTSSSGSFTNLQPNTNYTASCVVKNSAGLTTTIKKIFYNNR